MPHLTSILNDITQFHTANPSGVVILWWTTATGKTATSLEIARHIPSEIISADSRQLFRYMDIGTDKVDLCYRNEIPHHQIDIINPDQRYTAGEWQENVEKLIPDILARTNLPLIVWGTGLYIDMIYKNFSMPDVEPDLAWRETMYAKEETTPGFLHKELTDVDPVSAEQIHPHSTRYLVRALEIYQQTGIPKSQIVTSHPPKQPLFMLGLRREKDSNDTNIIARIHTMLEKWLIDEVQWLLDQWYSPELQSMQGIGYKQTVDFLLHHQDKQRLIDDLVLATCRYAKRQRTRLRRYIRDAATAPRPQVTYKMYSL